MAVPKFEPHAGLIALTSAAARRTSAQRAARQRTR